MHCNVMEVERMEKYTHNSVVRWKNEGEYAIRNSVNISGIFC